MKAILTFKLVEKRSRSPFPIQGVRQTYAHAAYNEKYGCHTFEMTLEDYRKCAEELVMGFNRPLCKFVLADIRVPEIDAMREQMAESDINIKAQLADASAHFLSQMERGLSQEGMEFSDSDIFPKTLRGKRFKLVQIKDRADWNFHDWYKHAKKIGVPRYSIIGKPGRKEPLIAAVEQHENAAKKGNGSDSPSPEIPEAAAA